MARRVSQHSRDKKGKRGQNPFAPDLKEWQLACKLYKYDTQIAKHFDICKETFYSFIDKQRCLLEQGKSAEFLDAYKKGRNDTTQFVLTKLMESVKNSDIAAIIFAAKTYGGLKEAKDTDAHLLKKKEYILKSKQYLTDLAKKFELNYEQLCEFSNKYFSDIKD